MEGDPPTFRFRIPHPPQYPRVFQVSEAPPQREISVPDSTAPTARRSLARVPRSAVGSGSREYSQLPLARVPSAPDGRSLSRARGPAARAFRARPVHYLSIPAAVLSSTYARRSLGSRRRSRNPARSKSAAIRVTIGAATRSSFANSPSRRGPVFTTVASAERGLWLVPGVPETERMRRLRRPIARAIRPATSMWFAGDSDTDPHGGAGSAIRVRKILTSSTGPHSGAGSHSQPNSPSLSGLGVDLSGVIAMIAVWASLSGLEVDRDILFSSCTNRTPPKYEATAPIALVTAAAINTIIRPSRKGPEMMCGKKSLPVGAAEATTGLSSRPVVPSKL